MRTPNRSLTLVLTACAALALAACGDDDKATTDTAADADATDADVAEDTADDTAAPGPLLHVPSPEWRDQVIYFVMTDRFANGDPQNDDQGAGEHDPTSAAKYSGGDLQGVIDHLDYIQTLGATAVWITPPVANQWWDPLAQFSGYHGYWGRNFKAVDEHYGTLETYQALSDALHRRGMYLIQDIVPNHTGNFFTWPDGYDPEDPQAGFTLNTGSLPTAAPEQAPFDQNDATDPDDFAAAIYHWTPLISDFNDPVQEKTWEISDLDDLNTENPVVRDALRDSYGYWIREVGVDGFRIDTVKFVDHPFWNDFLHGTDETTPGIEAVAKATGRDGFLTFGEVYEVSDPGDDAGELKCVSYLGTAAAPELDAVLGFPLYEEIKRVIGGGDPTTQLTYRLGLANDPSHFPDPGLTPNFIDNHDVQRFLAGANEGAFRQALVFLMTIPGIPVIYQGTEQAFVETRTAMFAGGWGADGVDHFDTDSAPFVFLKDLIATRTGHPVLARGDVTVLRDAPFGPGAFVYRRQTDSATALVLLNTSEHAILVNDVDTGIAEGTHLDALVNVGVDAPVGRVELGGRLLTELPARGALVLLANDQVDAIGPGEVAITVDTPISGETFSENTDVTGSVTPTDTALLMVVDDKLESATAVTVATDGSFTATLPVDTFPYGDTTHTVTFYAQDAGVASQRYVFTSSTVFDGQILEVDDPVDDDSGPTGAYTYPQDTTFAGDATMDVTKLVIEAGATTLRLRFTMAATSIVWNPSNGFDHVAFTIYFDLPDSEGLTLLPKIQATAPDGFAWDFTHFAFGWTNTVYNTADASETKWGTGVPGRPVITVDLAANTISFEYDAARFGLTTWEGVSVYATTWDFDGIDNVYRALSPDGGPWAMGGGEATDPLIMDDVGPVLIPVPSD
ncbi:MAG: alpha-amylase [Deltaproteobacteria bacterium]|nr:MAG: alpha-amylase [Deltaproteobacteria bacterium]